MSLNFIEFANTVNLAVPALENEFQAKATQLIARFNVASTMPSVPTTDAYYSGGKFTASMNVAAANFGQVPIETLTARDVAFTDPTDQVAYLGAIKAAKGFYDKWFGTPTADQLLTDAYTNLINGSVNGLVDEYIAINSQEAKEIRTQAMLTYSREEDTLLAGAAQFKAVRMPGPVHRELGLLKEKTHESIRDRLRQLGGEGLQRDYQLILGTITERLKLNTQAKQAMGEWIQSLDNPLYAAKTAKDNQHIDGQVTKAAQLMDLSSRVQSFDKQGINLANERLAAVRNAAFAPSFGQHDRNKLELNHLTRDLTALSTELAGTYAKIRGTFGMSWGSGTSQAVVRTTT